MSDLTGQNIGRYHIVEQLGRGGMATVYKAYDTRLEREVAFKVIRRESVGTEYANQMLKRFEREAKVLAKLSHPNIVSIHDYGEYEGSPYLVMEYIRGGTLSSKLNRQPIPYQEAAAMLAPVARALEYAHKQKLIHRDVKPSNVLLDDEGRPMLSDFGIAKILETDETAALTGTGVGIGTPEYMAPEQSLGKDVDHRADIYALGIIFFEMLTGRKPYQAETPMAVVIKHINDPLPRPKNFVPSLPDDVEAAVFRALAKRPEDRYQDMGQFAAFLEKIAHEAPTAFQKVDTDQTVTRTASQLPPLQPVQPLTPPQVNIPPARTGMTGPTGAVTGTTYGGPRTPITGVQEIPVQPKKSAGWVLWAAIGGGVLLLGACVVIIMVFVIANPGTATPTPKEVAQEEPTATRKVVEEPTETPWIEPTVEEPPTPTRAFVPTFTDIPQITTASEFAPGMNTSTYDMDTCKSTFMGDALIGAVLWRDPYYCDTFDDPDNWSTGGDTLTSGSYSTYVSGGRFSAYVQANEDFIYYQRLEGPSGSNLPFLYSVDLRRVDGTSDSGFGMLFRYDADTDNYYLFEVADGWGTYIVLKYQNSAWTTIQTHTNSSAIRPSDWNRILVFSDGTNYDIYINGEYVYSFQDTSLRSNGIGFAAEVYYSGTSANFEYDNFLYVVEE